MWGRLRRRYAVPLILGLSMGGALVVMWMAVAALRDATPSLENAGAVSWADYWLNRYQTLMTGVAALLAAGIAVAVTWRQGERARADEAERALNQYAVALLNVMNKHENASPPAADEKFEDALKRLED